MEFDFSDSEPTRVYGNGRLCCEFVGTTSVVINLDPAEFDGLSVSEAAEEILMMLTDMAPNVDFNEHDIVLAANELVQ